MLVSVKYVIDRDRNLVFSREAAATLQRFRSDVGDEAGGILLGRVYPHSVEVEIATAPTTADRSGRYFFHRDRRRAQATVNQEWQATSGERIYLGEWHSHLERRAHPSARDTSMILNMLRDTKMELTFLFLVVLGTAEDWVGLASAGDVRRLAPVMDLQIRRGS